MRLAVVALLIAATYAPENRRIVMPIRCDVTLPNDQPERGFYGNHALSVSLEWPDGTVVFKPGGPGFVLPDGALSMKFGWRRVSRGRLTIDGRLVDAAGPPLRADVPAGYGEDGFQATALIFPTPGCWQVTGHVGKADALTFVIRVVKIGSGPVGTRKSKT